MKKIIQYIDNISPSSSIMLKIFMPFYIFSLLKFLFTVIDTLKIDPQAILITYEPIFRRLCFYLVLELILALLLDILYKKDEV